MDRKIKIVLLVLTVGLIAVASGRVYRYQTMKPSEYLSSFTCTDLQCELTLVRRDKSVEVQPPVKEADQWLDKAMAELKRIQQRQETEND